MTPNALEAARLQLGNNYICFPLQGYEK